MSSWSGTAGAGGRVAERVGRERLAELVRADVPLPALAGGRERIGRERLDVRERIALPRSRSGARLRGGGGQDQPRELVGVVEVRSGGQRRRRGAGARGGALTGCAVPAARTGGAGAGGRRRAPRSGAACAVGAVAARTGGAVLRADGRCGGPADGRDGRGAREGRVVVEQEGGACGGGFVAEIDLRVVLRLEVDRLERLRVEGEGVLGVALTGRAVPACGARRSGVRLEEIERLGIGRGGRGRDGRAVREGADFASRALTSSTSACASKGFVM